MILAGKVWNGLSPKDRMAILRAAYPSRSQELISLEGRKKWNQLLPSTQQVLLHDVDFSAVLDRDVQP